MSRGAAILPVAAAADAVVADGLAAGSGGARHVAIIMDGNGRWAKARRLPRLAGHRAGVEAVRRVVEAAPDLGIEVLTLYAFSTENWKRPAEEVSDLMGLLRHYIRSEIAALHKNGVRLTFIGNYKAMKPDLVIGFSDLQKDIASQLIGRGLNVLVTNQRSLGEILNNILLLGRIIGEEQKALKLIASFVSKLARFEAEAKSFKFRPKVYFEEWDKPHYSCIQWVSELIYAVGGQNIFQHKTGAMARDREVQDTEVIELNPDIIFGCWCGKKVNVDSITRRSGYEAISAVKSNQVWELDPAIYLQPGPALFVDGLDQMFAKIQKVAHS